MRAIELEYWVRSVVDAVLGDGRGEDSRVELKTEWPVPDRAARALGGHANASRGDQMLWIVGIDEKAKNLVGATREDLADWWPQVQRFFDGGAPELVRDINVVLEGGVSVVALLFDSDLAPYVVRTGEDKVQFEVPWRGSTSVRSAKRADLLRILVPIAKNPRLEVMKMKLGASVSWQWDISIVAYMEASHRERIVIPFHRSKLVARIGDAEVVFNSPTVLPLSETKGGTMFRDGAQLVVDGPGLVQIKATAVTSPIHKPSDTPALVRLELMPTQADLPVVLTAELEHGEGLTWRLRR